MKAKLYYIDTDKFRYCLASKKLTQYDASRKMGYGASYMSKVLGQGYVTIDCLNRIESILKIDRHKFVIGEGASNINRAHQNIELVKALSQHGVTLEEASEAMGYQKGYISTMLSMGKQLSKPVKAFLEIEYGIKPEEYEKENDPIEEETPAEKDTKTEDAIYRATYSAIMNTWAFIREDLKTIIKEALSE